MNQAMIRIERSFAEINDALSNGEFDHEELSSIIRRAHELGVAIDGAVNRQPQAGEGDPEPVGIDARVTQEATGRGGSGGG